MTKLGAAVAQGDDLQDCCDPAAAASRRRNRAARLRRWKRAHGHGARDTLLAWQSIFLQQLVVPRPPPGLDLPAPPGDPQIEVAPLALVPPMWGETCGCVRCSVAFYCRQPEFVHSKHMVIHADYADTFADWVQWVLGHHSTTRPHR